jgi:DNA/RNA endonuclease YhcR with UshA esterase domain
LLYAAAQEIDASIRTESGILVPKLGHYLTVERIVSDVYTAQSGKATFIDIDGVYPENTFTAVIFHSDISKFPDVSRYRGKRLDITGRMREYRGKTEIVLTLPDQLRLAH